MRSDKILFIDTETGGLDPAIFSLLSIGFAVWQNSHVIDSKEILVNDGKLKVSPQALEINKIDIEAHKMQALTPEAAIEQIDTFLDSHFSVGEKITLAGHNVNFDVNFFREFLKSNKRRFEDRFSHRFVDTSSILYYLYLSEKIKHKAVSSDQAFKWFKIKVEKRHSALGDAIATAQLFSVLLRLTYKKVHIDIEEFGQGNLFESISDI